MASKTKRNVGKFLAIYFATAFCCAFLALWIFAPDAFSQLPISELLGRSLVAGVMSGLLIFILHKSRHIPTDDASKAEYVDRAQAEAGNVFHWSRSPILWIGGATVLLFCFLRFVVIG